MGAYSKALGTLALAASGLQAPQALLAQDGGVSLEVGAARAFPPSGTDAAQASYGMFGFRAERWTAAGSGLWAGAYAGRALDAAASDWASADVGATLWARIVGPLDLGLGASGYAFTVSEPFVYRAATGTADAKLRVSRGRLQFLLNSQAGLGRSVIEVHQTDIDRLVRNGLDRSGVPPTDVAPIRRAEQELWHYGGGPEVRVLGSRSIATLSGNVYESPNGTYRKATVSVAGYVRSVGGPTWRIALSAWDTPQGEELTGGLAVSVPLGGRWSARVSGLRSEPSPLIRTRGGRHGGLMLQWKPIAFDGSPPSVYSVSTADEGMVARFALEHADASEIEVVGDFTGWQPVAMQAADGEWVVSLPVLPGVYHFGFLVDGEWYLPEEGIPGRISDEWGRDNGTLVVTDDRDGGER